MTNINYNNLISTIVSLVLNLIVFILLIVEQKRSKNKINGLKLWLISNLIRFISIFITFLNYDKNTNYKHISLEYISYLVIIFSYFLLDLSLLKFVNKKINNKKLLISFIPIPILFIPIILNNFPMFIYLTIASIGYYIVTQTIIVFYNIETNIKPNWITYTILQLFVALFVVLYLIFKIIGNYNNILSIIDYSNVNTVTKSVAILSALNSLLIYLTLETSYYLNQSKVNQLLSMLLEISNETQIVVKTKTQEIIDLNDEILNNLNYKRNDIINTDFANLFVDVNDLEIIRNKLKNEVVVYETVSLLDKYKSIKNFDINFRKVNFKQEEYCLIGLTEKTNNDLKYKTLAFEDELTKLPNRRSLIKEYENFKKLYDKFYFIIIDIDKFKSLNDTKGHLFGDKVLTEIGILLNKYNSNNKNIIASRYGGDEFVLLKPYENTNINDFIMELKKSFNENIFIDKKHINLKISIGYSVYPNNGKNIDDLFKKADKYLFIHKKK